MSFDHCSNGFYDEKNCKTVCKFMKLKEEEKLKNDIEVEVNN